MADGAIAAPRPAGVRVDARLVAAIAAVWVLWGSTYAAMHVAVSSIPPFAMASLRFLIAGAALVAFAAVRGRARIGRADVVRATITGATLLLFGNGVTAWTVQYLPTGLNALLLSLAPVWMAIIAFLWGRERPTRLGIAGMLLGFAGLALLLRPSTGSTLPLVPAIVAVLASVSWAFGSVYQRRAGGSGSLALATGLQMLAGGALLGIAAALSGQWRELGAASFTPYALGGLLWLIVCGSLLGYSAYLYTMRAASTALGSTYAYVNPLVAVALGIGLFGERFTLLEAIASAIIIAGVVLMMLPAKTVAR